MCDCGTCQESLCSGWQGRNLLGLPVPGRGVHSLSRSLCFSLTGRAGVQRLGSGSGK